MSVAELARRTLVDGKRLWYILNGQRKMRADEFVRLCVVLDIDLGFFLDNDTASKLIARQPSKWCSSAPSSSD